MKGASLALENFRLTMDRGTSSFGSLNAMIGGVIVVKNKSSVRHEQCVAQLYCGTNESKVCPASEPKMHL